MTRLNDSNQLGQPTVHACINAEVKSQSYLQVRKRKCCKNSRIQDRSRICNGFFKIQGLFKDMITVIVIFQGFQVLEINSLNFQDVNNLWTPRLGDKQDPLTPRLGDTQDPLTPSLSDTQDPCTPRRWQGTIGATRQQLRTWTRREVSYNDDWSLLNKSRNIYTMYCQTQTVS